MNQSSSQPVASVPPPKGGNAVGVPSREWFIAIVRNNTECSCCAKLEKLGYDCFAVAQKENVRTPSGKMATKIRVILPSAIFIHVTEDERKQVVALPFVNKFMTDKASTKDCFNRHSLAKIPSLQIERLRFMLGQSDTPVSIVDRHFQIGDKVQIVRGALKGLEGQIARSSGKTILYIDLSMLGCATMQIDPMNVELIK